MSKVHILSSTFKILTSIKLLYSGWVGVDACKNILSNYDISQFKTTVIPMMFYYVTASVTFQGDNSVLLQQIAKYLMKKVKFDKDLSTIKKSFKSSSLEDAVAALDYFIAQNVSKIK